MTRRRALTRSDLDHVMRRAAELEAQDGDSGHADAAEFTDDELVGIGREVGLSERHIRTALAEHRAGGSPRRVPSREALRRLVSPGKVVARRTIERPRETVRGDLDQFMVGGQLLQRVRRQGDFLQYRPAVDWASRVARAASSSSRQHYVSAARMVDVRLEAVEPQATHVEIAVDPGVAANYQALAVLLGGGAAVAAGIGVAVALLALGVTSLAVGAAGGVVAGATVAYVGALGVARMHQERVDEVRREVEGVLDGLETEKGLEPPPPAWRQWVLRHFHGVAREITGGASRRR